MNEVHISTVNQEFFDRLIIFARELSDICDQLSLEPVVYGSLAYAYYTKDKNISVNDIDFLMPELDLQTIAQVLEGQKSITFETTTYHSLKVFKQDIKISFDSMEHYLKDLSSEFVQVTINGTDLRIINLSSLKEVYRLGAESIPIKKDAYSKKLEKLNQITAFS